MLKWVKLRTMASPLPFRSCWNMKSIPCLVIDLWSQPDPWQEVSTSGCRERRASLHLAVFVARVFMYPEISFEIIFWLLSVEHPTRTLCKSVALKTISMCVSPAWIVDWTYPLDVKKGQSDLTGAQQGWHLYTSFSSEKCQRPPTGSGWNSWCQLCV